jgi:hypothetical protein
MNIIETIDIGTFDGFDIKLFALVEETFIVDSFDSSIYDVQNLIDGVNKHELMWFCAKVTAYKNGIKLDSEYLGGCLYESLEEFMKDPYFEDMKGQVIENSKTIIKELTK